MVGGKIPQPMRPHGFWGGVFGWFMGRRNARLAENGDHSPLQ